MKNQCNMAYMAMYNLKMNTYNILNKVPNVSSLSEIHDTIDTTSNS